MILIVAGYHDDVAERLVSELPADSAARLTCLDLSSSGWQVRMETAAESICVISGRKLEARAITGVVGMLPRIFEQELDHIASADRTYVAAEMTAFLVFWLSSLPCPKLNPPSPGCLSGPRWPAERWLTAAGAAGLAVRPSRRGTRGADGPTPEECVTVTVVGRRCLGPDDPGLRRQARTLAAAAGVGLLSVQFAAYGTEMLICGVDPFPDLGQAGAAEAIHEFFEQAEGA